MSNELFHYGIKGQKWGVRRFQNEDGTYTELGKKYRKAQRTNNGTNEHSVLDSNFSKTPVSDIYYSELTNKGRRAIQNSFVFEDGSIFSMNWLKSQDGIVAIDRGKNAVAGFILIDPKEKYIAPLEVMEDYRGQGISKQLVSKISEKYPENELDVYVDNAIARKVYDDAGYVAKGYEFFDDGVGMIRMKKG